MIILAELTRMIHFLVFFLVLLGHSLLPLKYIKYYLILVILIFLDWNDIDGQCILTKLESYFRTGNWTQKPPIEGGPEFFRPLINKIFKLNLNAIEADRFNNFVFVCCWAIGYIRIYSYLP